MTTTCVRIASATSVENAVQLAIPDDEMHCVLLPSSLRAEDRLARVVASAIARRGGSAQVSAPATGVAGLVGKRSARRISLNRDDCSLRQLTFPADLLDARQRIAICDLDDPRLVRSGPFILDLLARYAPLVERLRFVARDRLMAEANLAARIDAALIAMHIGSQSVAIWTTDRIAAELVALAAAEVALGSDTEFTGPWEDAVVQRATELDLGVASPAEIEFETVAPAETNGGLAGIVDHLRLRMGMHAA